MGGIVGEWKPSTLHLILFAVGGGLVYLGEDWGIPGATEIGIAILGVLIVAAGLDVIIKRLGIFRIEGWSRAEMVETYRGLAELLWGFIFVCIGLVIMSVVVMNRLAPTSSGTLWGDMLISPVGIGVILSGAGALMLINGMIRALAGSGRVVRGRLGGVPYVLDRIAGAVIFLVGAATSAVGLLLLTAPGVVTSALERARQFIQGSL